MILLSPPFCILNIIFIPFFAINKEKYNALFSKIYYYLIFGIFYLVFSLGSLIILPFTYIKIIFLILL